MTVALSLNPAAAPAAAAAAPAASSEAGAARFSDALRNETAAAAPPAPENDATAAQASDPGAADETAPAADGVAAAQTTTGSRAGAPTPRATGARAVSSPENRTPNSAEPAGDVTEPGAAPLPNAASLGMARTGREVATASDTAPPTLAAPEALLQWLDQLKTFAAPSAATAATAATVAASSPALQFAAAPPAADSMIPLTTMPLAPGNAAVTQLMIEALAAGNPEASTALAATAPTPTAPLTTMVAAAPLAAAAPSAPAAALTPVPVAMDRGDWPQQLGEQIQWRLGVGIQEARIEISPRELGAVDVRLSIDDNGLRVHLSAAQAQTRELLLAELPRLREALQQGGLQLSDAQVGREAPGRQSEQQSSHQRVLGSALDGRPDEGESATVTTLAGGWRARRGLLDDYA